MPVNAINARRMSHCVDIIECWVSTCVDILLLLSGSKIAAQSLCVCEQALGNPSECKRYNKNVENNYVFQICSRSFVRAQLLTLCNIHEEKLN